MHKTFIMFIRVYIGIPKKHKIGSGTKLIYLFEFKVFRHEERERDTQFLTMLTVCTSSALNSLTQPTRGHPVDPNWSHLGELRKSTPPRLSPKLN